MITSMKMKDFWKLFFDTKILHVLNENELQSLGNEHEANDGGGWLHHRNEVKPSHPNSGIEFYEWLSKETCKSLQFSEVGMARIEKFIGEKPFSDNTVSVGFHVRRGDKLRGESKLYEGHEYVEKALIAVNGSRIDTCFVASDDFEAGEELKRALTEKKVGCKFYTLDDPSEHGNEYSVKKDGADTLRFIAELSILSQVTYFVGTFDSNVGVLVSLLRSCYTKDNNHFYQSYSVSGKEMKSHGGV